MDQADNRLYREKMPDGEYAIVEFFGHTTMVGRVTEVERFGSKMLALEPIFNGVLLEPIYHGGASIYRMTPCSIEVARERAASELWQLPPTVRAVVPAGLLAPAEGPDDVEGETGLRDDPDFAEVPDYEASPGQNIGEFAADLIATAVAEQRKVTGKHNDLILTADKDSSITDVLKPLAEAAEKALDAANGVR